MKKNMEIEKILRKSMDETAKAIAGLKVLTEPIAPDNAIGRLSRMEAISEKSVNERALRNAENKLLRLEEALHRIKKDEYGVCLNCEEPIPKARLKVLPEASICLNCAKANE
jgi:DnaK suppressor protein